MVTPERFAAPLESTDSLETPQNPDLRRSLSSPRLIVLLLLFGLGAWAYWPTIAGLVRIWNSSPDYSHGYLVIPLAGWFLWRRREKLPGSAAAASWAGLSLIALAGFARLVAARYYFPELDGWSLPLWLCGVCWLFGGVALARWASPALAFLVFMVPLPASIELLLNEPLQSLATAMSTWMLQSLGQPAIPEGTTILLDDHVLEVERACSGLRMFYGILALGVAYIIVQRPRLSVSLVLLAAVAPVAIVANVLRITATGLLYQYVSSDAARRFSHDLAGVLMIVLAVVLFGLVLWTADRTLRQFQRTRSRALLRTAVALLVVAALLPTSYLWHEHLQKQTVGKFLLRANQLEETGEYLRAIDYFDRYLRVRPDDVAVHVRLAQSVDRIANNPLRKLRAMELYRDAWALDPTQIDLGFREGQLAIDLARFDEALAAADRLGTTSLADKTAAQAAAARLKALALLGRSMAPDAVVTDDEWKTVVTAFEEAIRKNPTDIELAARLADIYRHSLRHPAEPDRQKLADKTIDAMVVRNPDRPEAWLARYVYRKSLKLTGERASDADADLDKALEIGRRDPAKENADVLLYAGQRAADRRDPAAARRFFERATVVRPMDHRGWLRWGELAAADGTDEGRTQAVAIWEKGLQSIHQTEMELILPLAATLIELRRYADAEEKLRPLDAALPHLIEPGRSLVELGAARLRAGAAAAKGDSIAAASVLRNVLNVTREGPATAVYRTQFADAWLQLGDYYAKLKTDDQATEAYEAAGRLDAEAPDWRSKAAAAAERNGRPADAVQQYRALVAIDPNNAAKWIALARASFLDQVTQPAAARNWQEFESAFKKGVEKKGNGVSLYLLEADYAAARGQLDQAVKVLTTGTSRIPKAWELWQAMAIMQQRRGAESEARKTLAEFEKRSPTPEAAPLFESRLAVETGKFDEARRILESRLDALPDGGKAAVRNQLVEIDLRQGKRALARRRLEEMTTRDPNNQQTLDLLAQILADDRDWKSLEVVENRLKKVEGDEGTLWREYRIRRLLAETVELDDPRFREAERLTREIAGIRPGWQRRYVLEGALARRQNQLDEAIAAFKEAIRLGNRSIGLSEELIDLLNEQHRYTEADRELQRVRQAVARSSRLSSVAIPIFVRRGESDEALRLAEDWVKRQPNDANNHVRLGRTILLTTLEGSPDYAKAVEHAESEFERAVELDPTDVKVWIVLFRFYSEIQKNGEAADAMLKRLAQRIDVPQPQKVFVLAQLYESIGNRGESGRLYLKAIQLAPPRAQSMVLQRAAQFFVSDDPAQAEAYCRQILKRTPKSVEARRTLVRALAEQGGEQRMREAASLLMDVGRVGGGTAADRRLEAILLARTGRTEDRQRAIELLEELVQIPQQAQPRDRVLLASLYEREQRLMPAHEQFRAVSRQDDVAAVDLVRYAEFLYRNVKEQPQFADYAKPVLARLDQNPQSAPSAVRLRLTAAKKIPQEKARRAAIRQIVDDAAKRFVTDEKKPALRSETLSKLLILLAREDLADEAIRLVKQKNPCADAAELGIALADALTVLPPGSALVRETEGTLRQAVETNPRSAELLYAVGNFRCVSGSRDEAVALYRKALEIQPGHKLAMNNLALALAERSDGLPEALSTIDRAIAKFGADGGLLDTKGQILVFSGKAQEALPLVTEAAAAGNDPVVMLHLSNAYLAAGRPAEARAVYRRARAYNVGSLVVTPSDRTIVERLEAHVQQTAASGG